VNTVLRKRDQLSSDLTEFLGRKLVAGTFHAFVDKLHKSLPQPILRSTVQASVLDLLKKELTTRQLVETCWRLAGNLETLRDQEPARVWQRQTRFEWVPVQIMEARALKREGRFYNRFVFQSQAGSIVPRRMVQHWSTRKTRYLTSLRNASGYGFGFGKHRRNSRGEQMGRMLYLDVRQMYRLRCWLLLDPHRSGDEPVAFEIGHTGSTMSFNRELIRGRDRYESRCLKGYPTAPECHACIYGTDHCPLGTHRKTYTKGTCPMCKKEAYFDPLEEDNPELCLQCAFEVRDLL